MTMDIGAPPQVNIGMVILLLGNILMKYCEPRLWKRRSSRLNRGHEPLGQSSITKPLNRSLGWKMCVCVLDFKIPHSMVISRKPSPAYLVIDRPRRNETGFREPRECAPPYSTPVVDACFMLFGGMVGRQGPTPLRLLLFFFSSSDRGDSTISCEKGRSCRP